jgi:thiol peroxidase
MEGGKKMQQHERIGIVTLRGNPVTLVGDAVNVGEKAPDFVVTTNDLSIATFSELKGRVTVLASVPSLDTEVCSIEALRFNKEAASLGAGVRILVVSMDLPFAQKRWCAAEGVKAVQMVSDHRDASFGLSYGVLIKELRLLARAVFVVDSGGVVRHAEVVNEVAHEPDYARALAVVRKLV